MEEAMNIYLLLLLRLVHIVAGVGWVGGAAVHTLFVEPSARATAPESGRFMQYFMGRRRYSTFMAVTSGLTVLAGSLLLWNSSAGLQPAWLTSGPGLMFTIGSAVGIVVYLWGTFLIAPRASRLSALGKALAAAGGPPSPAQAAELQKLDREMAFIVRVDFALLMIALLAMATARYWYL
jgi:uncharacterized membrane protein